MNKIDTQASPFDKLHRYLFDGKHVRGELVQLQATYQQMLAKHNYPKGVSELLGELLVATSLLTATLKFEGEISVQLQGDGPVGYMVINGTMNSANNLQHMRGIAKLKQATEAQGLKALIGKGSMVITIRPKKGEAYQGVVTLEHNSLADCLSHYFEVSEQIPTKIWLFVDTQQQIAAGSLIQLLPDGDDKKAQLEDFEHLCQLTNTLSAAEIFSLSADELLYRLYHQENVRLYDPQTINYQCGCSEEKCLNAIAQLNADELKTLLAEQECITMTCDYCLTDYVFDEKKLADFIDHTNH